MQGRCWQQLLKRMPRADMSLGASTAGHGNKSACFSQAVPWSRRSGADNSVSDASVPPAAAAAQVREAISILDLDVTVYPTPRDGKVWRPKAVELGGKAQ